MSCILEVFGFSSPSFLGCKHCGHHRMHATSLSGRRPPYCFPCRQRSRCRNKKPETNNSQPRANAQRASTHRALPKEKGSSSTSPFPFRGGPGSTRILSAPKQSRRLQWLKPKINSRGELIYTAQRMSQCKYGTETPGLWSCKYF